MMPNQIPHPDSGVYTNGTQIAAALDRRAVLTLPQAVSAVRHFTMLLETRIKANASGRPGPNAPTGDYRRSWTHAVYVSGTDVIGVVGTNKPQGRRLEYGFVGTDTQGRTYNQRPYPHVGPAVEVVRPLFLEAMRQLTEGGGA
ncbi:hypothetical protein SRB5_15750 [Streptomyces sp. RB5]|uniref:HK97 gp10 family phage protein n=1 Tax=Streptomyces smaragdinus TaxID=2585196 RepID=A0A7K0CDA2_9ACTN|nr:HK97 gp10 family phage protein [Streptomyces smaragdinus]MQY11457.1 hypothetical protein [Streptomyces smaragdinus]